MWETALPFLGVILGAAIAGGVSLWREQVVTGRGRAARQAEREQRRKDERDAFQRDTLLALQDTIEAAQRVTVTEFSRVLTLRKRMLRGRDLQQKRPHWRNGATRMRPSRSSRHECSTRSCGTG